MLMKFLPVAAAAAVLALASTASAAPPSQLSDSQMDSVTAGSTAIADGASVTFGELLSDTFSQTSTNVAEGGPRYTWNVVAQSLSQGLATGGFLFQAASISHADSAAAL